MFVNRKQELGILNDILNRGKPSRGKFVIVYGRRRVGKTALIIQWAEQSGIPFTYWVAEKNTAALQRRELCARLLDVRDSQAPNFGSWREMWRYASEILGNKKHILLLDEFTYIADLDPGALSSLQHAWDQYFKESNISIVISGSHVQTMESIMGRQSPIFGRLTGQIQLGPLPFTSLQEFFPRWSPAELVNLYATVGGVPAYLEWLNPDLSYIDNLNDVLLSPANMFLAEPTFLLYDEVREPRTYLAILSAIGAGKHAFSDIGDRSLVAKTSLPVYLKVLMELRLVEKRVPATIKPALREQSRMGRYYLTDPYFRFYFRFLDPLRADLEYNKERVFRFIQQGLNSFVSSTAFEELSRQWLQYQSRQGNLLVGFEQFGQYWSRRVQVDVVGINWDHKVLFLGECKWEKKPLSIRVVKQLLTDKAPLVLDDLEIDQSEWRIRYGFFSRSGFTSAAEKEAAKYRAHLVSLDQLVKEVP